MSTKRYFRLDERNDWEGETWSFFVPACPAVEELIRLIALADLTETYSIAPSPVPAKVARALARHGDDGGYMARYNLLSGALVIPADLQDRGVINGQPWAERLSRALYKGGLREGWGLS